VSRCYRMTIRIKGWNKERTDRVKDAAKKEWNFENSYEEPDLLTLEREGNVCGETEGQFADRLAKAIWTANGGYCGVEVEAVYFEEEPPMEKHVRGKEDYKRIMGKGKK